MDNRDINNILEEINTTENITICLLRDMVTDYKRICRKQIVFIAILLLLDLILIMCYIFSIV